MNNKDATETLTIKNSKAVLVIMAEFAVARPETNVAEDNQPVSQGSILTVHEENLSRFALKIIDSTVKDSKRKVVTANIPATNMQLLADVVAQIPRTTLCIGDLGDDEPSELEGGAAKNEPVFRYGPYKGKTPSQALLADGDKAVEAIEQHIEHLANPENMKKYPANQQVIDAANAAIEAYKNGTLSASNASAPADKSAIVKVYDALRMGNRPNPDDSSRYFTYSLVISHDESRVKGAPRQYPWSIEIANYWCKPIMKNKLRYPDMSSAELIHRVKMNISEDEFRRTVNLMNTEANAFTMFVFMEKMKSLFPDGEYGRRK